jgi:hypothetical protein
MQMSRATALYRLESLVPDAVKTGHGWGAPSGVAEIRPVCGSLNIPGVNMERQQQWATRKIPSAAPDSFPTQHSVYVIPRDPMQTLSSDLPPVVATSRTCSNQDTPVPRERRKQPNNSLERTVRNLQRDLSAFMNSMYEDQRKALDEMVAVRTPSSLESSSSLASQSTTAVPSPSQSTTTSPITPNPSASATSAASSPSAPSALATREQGFEKDSFCLQRLLAIEERLYNICTLTVCGLICVGVLLLIAFIFLCFYATRQSR